MRDAESLRALREREIELSEETTRIRLSYLWNRSGGSQPEISKEDRTALLKWCHDLCVRELPQTGDELFKIPTTAVDIMDRFLEVCRIKRSQFQLTAVVCLSLAGKVVLGVEPIPHSKLVQYSDHSVKINEIKAWEMLVLSKLNWNLGCVIPQDYFEHWKVPQTPESIIKNAALLVVLSLVDKPYLDSNTSASRALSALSLAQREEGVEDGTEDETLEIFAVSRERLLSSTSYLESLMTNLIGGLSPRKPDDEAGLMAPPESSSTPKSTIVSKRSPLKENGQRRRVSTRKRLQSEFDEDEEEERNKENNDSAIGLNTSGLTEIPDSCSGGSASSSAHSSPDSATSNKRPLMPRNDSSSELDNVINTTQIPPLGKWWES